jgi:type IV pilus assembly protein PilC
MGLFTQKISLNEMVPLCRQMATAYDAGIPVLKVLQMAERGARTAGTRNVLLELRTSIEAGASLGDAARAQGDRLPPFFVELLSSGERGGQLDVMLRDLADYYEDRMALQRTIIGAMVYPAFMLTAAWFLGSFAIGIISNLSLDARNPFSLQDYFESYIAFQTMVLIGAAVAAVVLWFLSRTGLPQYAAGYVGTKLWPFSEITRKFALARFFRSFVLLLHSGLNVKHCIAQAAATTANPYIRQDLLRAIPVVEQGGTLHQAFGQCRTLTRMAHEMLAVGEESGRLDIQLKKVAEYHAEEAKLAVSVGLRFMNFALLLSMGGLVGYIVISFYSKYIGLLDSI